VLIFRFLRRPLKQWAFGFGLVEHLGNRTLALSASKECQSSSRTIDETNKIVEAFGVRIGNGNAQKSEISLRQLDTAVSRRGKHGLSWR
jgi:hypothetical protein